MRALQECDVVHIHRLASPEVQALTRHLHERGIGGPKSREMLAAVKAMVRLADVVTTPSAVLAEQYRELGAHDLRVLTLGLGLGLASDRYENRKLIPFLELARTLSCADIGIAPLADIPWNRARSNVKLKEYASAGLTWLASPVGPYLGMGEPHGGQLVDGDGWRDALEQLIADARRRRKLAKRAAKWAKGEGVERHAGRWGAALEDAAQRARTRVCAPAA